MTRVLLVRHARPAATWGESADAALDEVGREQAEAVADRLAPHGPLAIVTSPSRRARETALPLARRWGVDAQVVDAVGEVPSPTDDLEERGAWLRVVLTQRWDDVDPVLHEWRTQLLDALTALRTDTVVFTHYVAISTAVGGARGDDRLLCCHPGHASVTELDVDARGRLTVVSIDDPETGPPVDSPR